ncbi:MAG: prepilin-type N-terminal cleavage/methylation domain-containing protein [Elusimicrobiaceae bacterium]|nr:prepilin-type N-terminal cleavage/methylation domain-containing protein [Elusimicrobiaceae bacterium]
MKNHAFTLIELLVVVLIIGILAAIALPKYEKAVEKSRISTMIPTLKNIAEANEIYYLERGAYTLNIDNLSVSLPGNCVKLSDNGQLWSCGTDFVFDNSNQETILNYCPRQNHGYNICKEKRDLLLLVGHQYASTSGYAGGKWGCVRFTKKGTALCKSLGY